MARLRWDEPDEHDHVLLLADADAERRDRLREHLERIPGRPRAAELGRYPRFQIVAARSGDEALHRATPHVTAAALDLLLPRRNGIEVVRELRGRRPELALLAYTAGAPAADAVAAVMAGADFFHELEAPDPSAFERALELAIDRRRLTRLIERNEAAIEAARGELAQLSGERARALPGFRLPSVREEVLPFEEAARRYLVASARVFPGDTQELARRLGVSYFALRRLFLRFGVPLPSRSRKHGTGER